MPLSGSQLGLLLVFFIYGLAFFTLGLALALETRRTPRLAEGRVLAPLAVFGLLHGVHEWFEIYLIQAEQSGFTIPARLAEVRVVYLALSFLPLMLFCARAYRSRRVRWLETGLVLAFFGVVGYLTWNRQPQAVRIADIYSRYLLAVPGALLAAFALVRMSRASQARGRASVGRVFSLAALGFAVYGLTQVFVSPMQSGPAAWLNTRIFLDFFGFPIQAVRAAAAVWILVHLIQGIQYAEEERQAELYEAQQARLEALEQVQRELIERDALRRELAQHTVMAQEEERARIARELHDETAQLLTGISLNLAALQGSLPEDPRTGKLLARLQDLSREMSQGIYRMVHDLRPAQLDDLGLVAALQYLAEDLHKEAGLEVDLQISGPRRRLEPDVETVFFRVTQEALANTARHAGVNRAVVGLAFAERQVALQVIDEGSGFDLQAERLPPKGWGLAGMRERAESIGACFRLDSSPGAGTRIELSLNLAPEPEAAGPVHPHPWSA